MARPPKHSPTELRQPSPRLPNAFLRRVSAGVRALPLTPREKDVFLLLLRGYTNKQIATSCQVQEQTVKDHLKHVYDKLGVRRRNALVIWFVESFVVRRSRKVARGAGTPGRMRSSS